METPKFNNTPNEHFRMSYQTSNHGNIGLDYWLSRSIAVVGVVFVHPLMGGMQVLITKRSNKMRDEAGKYGVPCGYLDYDENCYEAMIREVYEETSLYLPKYKDFLIANNNEKPFTIHDNPNRDKRQNVSLIYFSYYDFSMQMNKFPTDILKYKDKETAEVFWMPLADFYEKYEREYEWAFQHNETIKEALSFYNSKHNEN